LVPCGKSFGSPTRLITHCGVAARVASAFSRSPAASITESCDASCQNWNHRAARKQLRARLTVRVLYLLAEREARPARGHVRVLLAVERARRYRGDTLGRQPLAPRRVFALVSVVCSGCYKITLREARCVPAWPWSDEGRPFVAAITKYPPCGTQQSRPAASRIFTSASRLRWKSRFMAPK
jgi:hypothetical protein